MKTILKIGFLLLGSNLFMGCAAFYYPEIGVTCPSTHTSSSYSNPDPDPDPDVGIKKAVNNTTDSETFLSYRVGVAANVPINEKFAFETGVHLAGKGNKTKSPNIEDKLNLTYIDVPLTVRYKIGSNNFSIYGGLQPSLLVNAKRKLNVNGMEDSQKITGAYKTLDMAASLGAGCQFNNGIRLNIGYDHGFVNINDFGGFKAYNRMFRFTVGYQFGKN